MAWIQTFTGKKIDPTSITPAMVDAQDIAHALANKCRFTGHCDPFYSVAEHCVRVADLVGERFKLYALLHDAAEAYLPDVATPLKLYFQELQEMEGNVNHAIFHAFCPDVLTSPKTVEIVKFADLSMLAAERRDLMTPVDGWDPAVQLYIDVPEKIKPWPQAMAKTVYLERLVAELGRAKGGVA
jgi:hypothetical protein